MKCQFWLKISATKVVSLFVLFAQSCSLEAATTLNTEVGGQSIFTSYSGVLDGLASCDKTTVDRRLGLSILPRGKWSGAETELLLGVESQVSDESQITPFHRLGKATFNTHVRRHQLGLALGYDDSQQVLWGCAASVATRLRREQRIREDLQVAGDRVRTFERALRYEFVGQGETISLVASEAREDGDYRRAVSDILLSLTKNLSSNIIIGFRGALGNEAIRDERYRNTRGGSNVVYKHSRQLTIYGDISSQRRGNIQRVTTWEARADHQYTKEILGSLIASRVVSSDGPRFSTRSFRSALSRTIGRSETRLEAGKVEVENPRNSNNLIGLSYSNQITPRHRFYFRVAEGTEFVAVIRSTRVAELRYNLIAIPDRSGARGNSLIFGASLNKTWLSQNDRPESQIAILEFSIRGTF